MVTSALLCEHVKKEYDKVYKTSNQGAVYYIKCKKIMLDPAD